MSDAGGAASTLAPAADPKQRRKSKEKRDDAKGGGPGAGGAGAAAGGGAAAPKETKAQRQARETDRLKQLFRDGDTKGAAELLWSVCDRVETEQSGGSGQESEQLLAEYAGRIVPPLLRESADPVATVLALVAEPALQRRKGSRLDLPVLLLRIGADVAEAHSKGASGAGIRPEHVAQAAAVALSGKVTPKVVQGLQKFYRVDLKPDALIAYGKKLVSDGVDPATAADFLTRFKLQAHVAVEDVLAPLIKRKQFDVVINYVEQYAPAAHYAITHIAERREGEDPEKALKLIERFGLKVSDYPRVMYLKKKDCVWWSVAIGKATEFADFLCAGDVKLQRYLCRRLLKRANLHDLGVCVHYLQQYVLTGDDEFKHVVAHHTQALADAKAGKPFVPAPLLQPPPSPTSPSAAAAAASAAAAGNVPPAELPPSAAVADAKGAGVHVASLYSSSPSPSGRPVAAASNAAPSPLLLPKTAPAAAVPGLPAPVGATAAAAAAAAAAGSSSNAAAAAGGGADAKTGAAAGGSAADPNDRPYGNRANRDKRNANSAAGTPPDATADAASSSGGATDAKQKPPRDTAKPRGGPGGGGKPKRSGGRSGAGARRSSGAAAPAAGANGEDDEKAAAAAAAAEGKVIVYDTLTMSAADITVVDDAKTLALAAEVLKKADVIGLDLEHMPENFKGLHGYATTCQVLQLACRERTFVLDLQKFDELKGMDELLVDVFDSEAIAKIGIGFDGDLHKLRADFPTAACFQIQVQNYIELIGVERRLPAALVEAHPPATHTYSREYVQSAVHVELMQAELRVPTPAKKVKKEGGLAKLVRLVLGKALNKDEQISNWGKRPLRPAQLLYAALDARCEVQLYDELFKIDDFDLDPITLDAE